jgi:hypothetical protein
MNRTLQILCAFTLIACSCSRSSSTDTPDFSRYLDLEPGTRIKVIRAIVGGPAAGHPKVREVAQNIEGAHAIVGTLVTITKTSLKIRPDDPKVVSEFVPAEVRSIEVLAEASP